MAKCIRISKRAREITTGGTATAKLRALYDRPMEAARTGALFSAFPYPTKISPETIALFIAAHTEPGDKVFDGFAGSGTTGIAALLCSDPTEAMKQEANRLGLNVTWGARRAVLYELGVLGSFIGQTLTNPPEPEMFQTEAKRLLLECEDELGWLYEARDPNGNVGTIRYSIWSEVVECPSCDRHVSVFDGCVERQPARVSSTFSCIHCAHEAELSACKRQTRDCTDELTGRKVVARVHKPVWMYGTTKNREWSRAARDSDELHLKRVEEIRLPQSTPQIEIPWGDLYRSGYHQGITHLHQFYTRRNLIVFAKLWQISESSPLREALRFWLLSYNASHATLMTRVVAKRNQKDLVVTSAQPGVLYVSGLPVEKNLFAGLKRKLVTIHRAFQAMQRKEQLIDVCHASCLRTDLPDESVDYVFTDPPYGGNIPYAEVNFINEAWLGRYTNSADEVTISRAQGKTCTDYELLMGRAFEEIQRVLKKGGKVTTVFHSASSGVWNALHRAYSNAGLGVELASILNKTQGSFKQVTTIGAVKGDPVLLLTKSGAVAKAMNSPVHTVTNNLIKQALNSHDEEERTPQRLYSRLVNHYLERQQQVPLDAIEFYKLLGTRISLNARPSA
jgi:DNA methylase